MKKVGAIVIALFISICLNNQLVFAEQNSPEELHKDAIVGHCVDNKRYVTTEDVLLTLLSSDIDNFVKDNYNETKQNWSIAKVKEVEYTIRPIKQWYEINLLLQVFEEPAKDSYHYDSITIQVGINDKEGKRDNTIELVNYDKGLK